MYGYAASSAATALTPFIPPPQTTNAGSFTGQTQTTPAELMSALPHQLQALASATSTNANAADLPSPSSVVSMHSPVLTAFNDVNTLTGPANFAAGFSRTASSASSGGSGLNRLEIQSSPAGIPPALVGPKASGPKTVRGRVLASVGEAAPVGKLSGPPGWMTATAVAEPTNGPVPLPDSPIHTAPAAANAHPGANTPGGIPMRESETTGSFVLRNGRRRFQMPRPPYGG